MADEEVIAKMAEICELLREQTRYVETVQSRMVRLQRISILTLAAFLAVGSAVAVALVWEPRRRAIELEELTAQQIQGTIEIQKRTVEQMDRHQKNRVAAPPL